MLVQSTLGSLVAQYSLPVALIVKLSRPRRHDLLLYVLISAEVFAGVEVAE